MQRILGLGLTCCLTLSILIPDPAAAHRAKGAYGGHAKVRSYRAAAPRYNGWAWRPIGFYSYTARDVINTFGDSGTKYGSMNFYRDWRLDRQSSFGPFDHGFFFDSAIAPRGGYAPYQQ